MSRNNTKRRKAKKRGEIDTDYERLCKVSDEFVKDKEVKIISSVLDKRLGSELDSLNLFAYWVKAGGTPNK